MLHFLTKFVNHCQLELCNTSSVPEKVIKKPDFARNRALKQSKNHLGRRVVDWEKIPFLNPLRPNGLRVFLGRHLVDTSSQISYPVHDRAAIQPPLQSKAEPPEPRRKRKSSLVPLLVLSPTKPLRWVSPGALVCEFQFTGSQKLSCEPARKKQFALRSCILSAFHFPKLVLQ